MSTRIGQRLTQAAQNERDDFDRKFMDTCCSCHIDPPCNYCIAPGNPVNQVEDDECWEDHPCYVGDGTTDRPVEDYDHDWEYFGAEQDVGIADHKTCKVCGETANAEPPTYDDI